jgi:MurNAc alpha-1-phosphate uridylyltransferase
VKVMILAAGLGERMRPLTNHTPKPLLRVGGIPLLEHHIRRLVAADLSELVINVSHLAEQIVEYFGDGSRWGATIAWSHESEPLETAGGIINVLPLLGSEPFMLVNGDVWTDFPFAQLGGHTLDDQRGAHLVLLDNPTQHPVGDFVLAADGHLSLIPHEGTGLTYSGLGLYCPGFFAGIPAGVSALKPLLYRAIERNCLSGEHYSGTWVDVGTPERLEALNLEVGRPAE